MKINKSHQENSNSSRILSIDVIRGLTILLMIFVNDLAEVSGVPAWMKHMQTYSDGMTFVDLVFPAFLVIVGMSLPFSIGRKLDKGVDLSEIWKHILIRVFGLLIIGFFMVNTEVAFAPLLISPNLWIMLFYLSIIIIWNKSESIFISNKWIKYLFVLLLILLAFIYKREGGVGAFQMQTSWWGILGLIGWAYLIACIFYISLRKKSNAIIGSIVLLYCFYISDEAGLLANFYIFREFIHASSTLGTHSALILTGGFVGILIQKYSLDGNYKSLVKNVFGFSLFLFMCGILLHQLNEVNTMFIISKNLATVPWALLSSAFTIWIWIVVFLLVDIKNIRVGMSIIRPAGENPLFAYILAPFVVELFTFVSSFFGSFNPYYALGDNFIIGLLRSMLFAIAMTWLAGYMTDKGIKLKL